MSMSNSKPNMIFNFYLSKQALKPQQVQQEEVNLTDVLDQIDKDREKQ